MFDTLGVDSRYTKLLAGATNMALADETKSQYKTAVNHIARVAKALNTDMSLPFDIKKTLNYVGFLITERNCSSKTISQYLSALRMYHLCQGEDPSCLRPTIVTLILKGREHWKNVQDTLEQKPVRVAVTLSVLKFLKRSIKESKYPNEKKLRLWAICCIMWNGSLRVHEILSKNKDSFDPLITLCSEDLNLITIKAGDEVKTVMRLHIKSPKERRIGTGVKLEIFENGTFCCPVKAYKKWLNRIQLREEQPLFMDGDECFTGQCFNRILTKLTASITDSVIRSHSFRDSSYIT